MSECVSVCESAYNISTLIPKKYTHKLDKREQGWE